VTTQERLVLVAAALLAAVVFVQGRSGILGPGVGLVLPTLAMLATTAALLHVLARLTRLPRPRPAPHCAPTSASAALSAGSLISIGR